MSHSEVYGLSNSLYLHGKGRLHKGLSKIGYRILGSWYHAWKLICAMEYRSFWLTRESSAVRRGTLPHVDRLLL